MDVVFSLIVPNVICYIATQKITPRNASIGICCILCREFLLRGTLLCYLLHENCASSTRTAVVFISALTVFQLQTRLWFIFSAPLVNVAWIHATVVTDTLSHVILFVICIQRFLSYTKNSSLWVQTFYAGLPVVGYLFKYLVIFAFQHPTYAIVVDIFVCILATIIPGRLARYEKSMAEHNLQSKRDFVSYISHEIRTPLNTVRMGIQLLSSRMSASAEKCFSDVIEIVKDIDVSCRIATEILDDFLVVNKIEDGTLKLDRRDVSVRQLLNTVVDPFDIQARHKDITFHHSDDTHVDPAIDMKNVHVHVDVNKFSQVLRNLISNALKFTPPGGRVDLYAFLTKRQVHSYNYANMMHIATPLKPRGSFFSDQVLTPQQLNGPSDSSMDILKIEVHDSGPGMSEDNMKRLFSEVVQFNAAELQGGGGSGLGLWISKGIMDCHGGTIGVTSTPGKGSVFFIEIEACSVEPEVAIEKRHPVTPSSAQSNLSIMQRFSPHSRRVHVFDNRESDTSQHKQNLVEDFAINGLDNHQVLVVDDSAVNRKMMCRTLLSFVDSVTQAGNGAEALNLVKDSIQNRNPFDVIFMDVNMPVMDGVEATRLIRESGYKGYIAFVTGNAMPEERRSFFAAGGDDVFIKPCTAACLERALLAAHKIKTFGR